MKSFSEYKEEIIDWVGELKKHQLVILCIILAMLLLFISAHIIPITIIAVIALLIYNRHKDGKVQKE